MRRYDVTIIGGGPAGLYAAFYCGMRALKTELIEANSELGGLITYFYPEKTIYDVGGIPHIKGDALVRELAAQAQTFRPTIIRGQKISGLESLTGGGFRLIAESGECHETRKIILAIGGGIFRPNKLQLAEAPSFEGISLFYRVRRLQTFAGKTVVISGGGNGALDWAVELAPICREVTVVYRGTEFKRVLESTLQRAERCGVRLKRQTEIVALSGAGGQLRRMTLHNRATGGEESVAADALIVDHGSQFALGGLEDWGLTIENGGIVVDRRMETTRSGIFAVGNAAVYPHKLYLIAAAFVESAVAVNSIKQDLDPQAAPQAMVSTHHRFFLQQH